MHRLLGNVRWYVRCGLQDLLLRSQSHTSSSLHDAILLRRLGLIHSSLCSDESVSPRGTPLKDDLTSLLNSGKARPSSAFWAKAFDVETRILATNKDSEEHEDQRIRTTRDVLALIHSRWAESTSRVDGGAEAGLTYANWLVRVAKDGAAASKVIQSVLAACNNGAGSDREDVERRWGEALSELEKERTGSSTMTERALEEGEMDVDIDIEIERL